MSGESWGLPAPDGTAFAWSARAIFQDGYVDILWDRQSTKGEASADMREAFQRWLNEKALPVLRERVRRVSQSSSETIIVRGDGFHLAANPRRSYGYLYIGAWPDETAKLATPTPTPLAKAKPKVPRGSYKRRA